MYGRGSLLTLGRSNMKTLLFGILFLFAVTGCVSPAKQQAQAQRAAQQLELERVARQHKATQDFITAADTIMARAQREANDKWTQAGKNKILISALDECLRLQAPKDADYRVVNEYYEVCRSARRWFIVNPTWKTNTAYGVGGAVAATIDFFGGFGLATTTLLGAGVKDLHDRNEIRKEFLVAIDRWNRFLVPYNYQSDFWKM
jgi:hypothetical protein